VTIAIQRLEDDRIAGFRNLRDRDLRRGDDGLFLVEGEVILPVLLGQTRHPVRAVLVSEAQARRLAGVLAQVPDGVPVYVAPQALLEGVVGFPMHRGVIALAARAPELGLDGIDELLERASVVVGLCGLTNHDNVGGVFRNAAAFGADAVLLDRASCDPLYRKAVRVSVGASMVVPFGWCDDETQLVDGLTARGFEVIALSPSGALEIGGDAAPPGKLALLLGAEGRGLAVPTLARCKTARIPMRPGWDSLNVASASAVALHWACQRVRPRSSTVA
jgi:tRNA G18 (ribose-2'-O)-methylase SpoU